MAYVPPPAVEGKDTKAIIVLLRSRAEALRVRLRELDGVRDELAKIQRMLDAADPPQPERTDR